MALLLTYDEVVSMLGQCRADLDRFSRFLASSKTDANSGCIVSDEVIRDVFFIANQVSEMFNRHFNPRVRNAAEKKTKETGGAGANQVH